MARWTAPHRNRSLRPDLLRCRSHGCMCLLDRGAGLCALWGFSGRCSFLLVLWLHGRKEKYFLDIVGIGEKHGEPIDAHAPAGCGRQPVFQGSTEVLVYEHGLVITGSLGLEKIRVKCSKGSKSSSLGSSQRSSPFLML